MFVNAFPLYIMFTVYHDYNVYYILDVIHYLAIPFALVKYNRLKNTLGQYVYITANRNMWHTMHVLGKTQITEYFII